MKLSDLSKRKVSLFCKKLKFQLVEFSPSFNNTYYLRMSTGHPGPQPEFEVTETYCIGINHYAGYDLSKQWVKFLSEIETKELSKSL